MHRRRLNAWPLLAALILVVTACAGGGQSPSPRAATSPAGGTGASPSAAGGATASAAGTTGASPSAAGTAASPGGTAGGAQPSAGAVPSLPPLTPQQISGSLTTMGFGAGDEIATTRVDMFKSMYPNVDVTITEGGFDPQPFLNAVAAGTPPDLVNMDRELIGTYAARNALMPLNECVTKVGIDMAQFQEAAVRQVTFGDQLYGIPEFHTVRIVVVNNTALKEAGVAPGDVATNDWEKLRAAAQKLYKNEGGRYARIGFDPKLPEFLPLWAKANGADLLSADGKTAQLTDPRVVEALTYSTSLIADQGGFGAFKGFRDSTIFEGDNNFVEANQVGAFPIEQFYINVLARDSPDVDVTIAPFLDKQGNPVTYATGNAWAIPRGAKNVDAACEWAHVMTSTQAWVAAAQARAEKRAEEGKPNVGVYQANKAADQIIFSSIVTGTGQEKFDKGIQVVRDAYAGAFSLPANPAGQEFNDAWKGAVNRVLAGQQSPADALAQAQQEAQRALDRAASR